MPTVTLEKFNKLMNRMEIGIDECLPDIPAVLVAATETLNDAYYAEGMSDRNYHEEMKRIDNITSRFFKECFCKNLRTNK